MNMNLNPKSFEIDVSIVMPCLDEAETIAACVDVAQEALARIEARFGMTGEIVVADNGSTDGSQILAAEAGARVVHISEKGYGAALRGGFKAARGRYLVMGDSDMSYDFREADAMIAEMEGGADLCMGNRFRGRIEPGAMPWKNRYIGNPALSAILRLLYKTPVGDSHCGLRAIRRSSYEDLRLNSVGMEFASEMVLKSALKGMKLAEVPVTLSPDRRGRPPHLNPFRDGFRHLFFMLMLCPTWLFFAPAAFLFTFGTVLMSMLIAYPDGEMVRIGAVGFGDHWAIVASACLVIATQTLVAGFATLILGLREGYLRPTPFQRAAIRMSSLPTWLLTGLGLSGLGFVWAASVAAGWARTDFGTLSEMRTLIAAFTLIVTGLQVAFGGFLLSIVSGNRMRHVDAVPALSRAA